MQIRLRIAGLIALSIIFSSLITYAAPSGVTYQGRILKPDGTPLNGSNVQFRMQIRAPDANSCLMYEELQSQNLSGSNGNFSLTINDGTGVRQDSTGLGLDRVFANRGTLTFDPATCASGNSYLAGTGDGRVLTVYFKDETMSTWEPMPPQRINFVPFAFESKQIAGFAADNLLRFAESDGTLVNTSPLNNAQYTELLALVNGTSNAFEKAGKLGGVSLPTLGAGQAGQVLAWNGTGWETSDTVPTNSITTTKVQDSAITSAKIADGTIAGADLAANIAINTTSTIATSGTMSSNIATTRDLRIYDADANPNENYVSIKVPASLSQNYNYVWPSAYGTAGQVLTTDATGNLSWAAPSAASQWSDGAAGAIYYNGGNVGLGTATPGTKLDVVGSMSVSGGAYVGFNGSSVINHTSIRRNNTINGLEFRSGNATSMVMLDSGNVGIGTIAPTGILDVESSRNGSAGQVNIRNTSNQNAAAASLMLSNDSGGANLMLASTGSGNTLSNFGANRNVISANSGGIDLATTNTGTGSTIRLFTGGSAAGNERLRIDDTGKIGIGKTNPSYLVDVNGAVNATSLKINGVDVAAGGTPGGATTQVQFNNAGAFGGSADMVWNNTNSWLGLNMTPVAPLSVSPKGSNYWAAKFRGNSSYKDVLVGLEGYDSTGRMLLEFNRPGVGVHSIGVDTSDNFYWGIGSSFSSPDNNIINMAANGNVAIGKGVTAPNGKLDVKGSVVMSGATSGYAGFRVPAAAGSSVWQLPAADGVSGQALVTDGAGILSWNSMASSNYWTKTISDLSYSAGNVGIGTATPSTTLDVVGTVKATTYQVGSNGFLSGTSGETRLTNGWGSGYLSFFTNNGTATAERVRIDGSGNVGIGTTAPTYKLDVTGKIHATSNVDAFNFNAISSGTFNPLSSYNSAGAADEKYVDFFHQANTFSLRFVNDAYSSSATVLTASRSGVTPTSVSFPNGSVGIGTTTPAYKLDVNGAVNATALKINGVDVTAGGSGPWTTATNDAYFSLSGNVGIGTSSPTTKLDVSGAAHVSGTFQIDSSASVGGPLDANSRFYVYDNPYFQTGDYNLQQNYWIYNGTANNTGIVSGVYNHSLNSRAGTNNILYGVRTTVDNLSSLGNTSRIIGNSALMTNGSSNTVTDLYALQGLVTQNGSGTASNVRALNVGISQTGGTITTGYGVYIDSIAGATNYGLYQSSSSNKNYFAGNVGIGTASPTQALDVTGAVKASTGVFGAYFQANDGCLTMSAGAIGNNCAGQDLSLRANNSVMMTVKSTGNVGIGTASPSSRLHVVGPNSGGYPLTVSGAPGTGPGAYMNIALNNTSSGAYKSSVDFQANGTTKFSFGVDYLGNNTNNFGLFDNSAGVHRMFIDSTGLIGMGTTSPTEKLEVVGNVKATSFISTSDARLKKNIVKTPGLDYIRKITGVQWQWKSDNKTDAGVIAQDVERVIPFAVVTDAKSGYKAVKYNALIAPLIESTKELYGLCQDTASKTEANSRAIASVQSENAELRKENQALKSRLDTLEERLKAIEAKLAK